MRGIFNFIIDYDYDYDAVPLAILRVCEAHEPLEREIHIKKKKIWILKTDI